MRKLIFGIVIGVGFTVMIGAGIESYIVNKQTAEVTRKMGLMVFTDCDPVMPFEKLGTIKIGTALKWSGDYGSMRDDLIKKAKKEYPNADGILCYPETNGMNSVSADVIKFK